MNTRKEEEQNSPECSSGCQSGWTMYLDRSTDDEEQPDSPPNRKVVSFEEEEEDLSMVSDASSGPPHFPDEDRGCAFADHNSNKKRRVETDSSPLLDDTASSPFFSFPKASGAAHKVTKEELSGGFSATHFKEKPAFRRHLGYSQSPTPAKSSVLRGEGEEKAR